MGDIHFKIVYMKEKEESELNEIIDVLDKIINLINNNLVHPVVLKGMGSHEHENVDNVLFTPYVIMLHHCYGHQYNMIHILSYHRNYRIMSLEYPDGLYIYGLHIHEIRDKFQELISLLEDKLGFIIAEEFLSNMYNNYKYIISMQQHLALHA